MGSQTPLFAIPYPVGTDRVMDGDNAMQALAERVEDRVGGCIASIRGPAATQDVGNTLTQILSVSVAFKATHRYKISASSMNGQISATGPTVLASLRIDNNEQTRLYSFTQQPASSTVVGSAVMVYTPTQDVTQTVGVYVQSTGGATRTNVNQTHIIVEDLGVLP